jgi:hypothetical protein
MQEFGERGGEGENKRRERRLYTLLTGHYQAR